MPFVMAFELIIVDNAHAEGVALIRLNRPKELNALNLELMGELMAALKELDNDDTVRCIVLTGNSRAFAAGADIKQMAGRTAIDMLKIDQFSTWDSIRRTKKPIIAAVNGFALGGGCELAMLCDMIIAGESARFGQPEIKIGTMPGAGGTARMSRAIGKPMTMEMVLTGRFMDADEAKSAGLINRVVPDEVCLTEAVKLAKDIAAKSPIAVQLAKESVLKAFEHNLLQALEFERKNFYMTFASEDQKEGMAAFVEKRDPQFTGK